MLLNTSNESPMSRPKIYCDTQYLVKLIHMVSRGGFI